MDTDNPSLESTATAEHARCKLLVASTGQL